MRDDWGFSKSGVCGHRGRSSLPSGHRDEPGVSSTGLSFNKQSQELCFIQHLLSHDFFPPNCSSRTGLVSHPDTEDLSYSGAFHVSTVPLFKRLRHKQKTLYSRLGFCSILCIVFLISLTFSTLDGEREIWASVTRSCAAGRPALLHNLTVPRKEKSWPLALPLGQSQTAPGASSLHLLLYFFFAPKVCELLCWTPGLEEGSRVHR